MKVFVSNYDKTKEIFDGDRYLFDVPKGFIHIFNNGMSTGSVRINDVQKIKILTNNAANDYVKLHAQLNKFGRKGYV